MRAFETADQAAAVAADMLTDGERLSRLSRPPGARSSRWQRDASSSTREKAMSNDSDDFTRLDDTEFIAERRRVREALEHAASPEMTTGWTRRPGMRATGLS
jgi:hypothetical protein